MYLLLQVFPVKVMIRVEFEKCIFSEIMTSI